MKQDYEYPISLTIVLSGPVRQQSPCCAIAAVQSYARRKGRMLVELNWLFHRRKI